MEEKNFDLTKPILGLLQTGNNNDCRMAAILHDNGCRFELSVIFTKYNNEISRWFLGNKVIYENLDGENKEITGLPETHSETKLNWEEHISIHNWILNLISIASLEKYNFSKMGVGITSKNDNNESDLNWFPILHHLNRGAQNIYKKQDQTIFV